MSDGDGFLFEPEFNSGVVRVERGFVVVDEIRWEWFGADFGVSVTGSPAINGAVAR